MMSLISAARMSMACSSWPYLLGELIAELAELGADAAVVDDVAHLGDDASQQGRVLTLLDLDLLARQLLERGGDGGELRGGERGRRGDLGLDPPGAGLEERVDLAGDPRQLVEPLLVEQHVQEGAGDRLDREARRERVDDLLAVGARERRVRQDAGELLRDL